jgi:hypothetical protein
MSYNKIIYKKEAKKLNKVNDINIFINPIIFLYSIVVGMQFCQGED